MPYKIAAVAGFTAMAVLLGSTAAEAHAHLISATPAAGASVKASPRLLRARFSEALVAQFSALELTTDKGAPIAIGKAKLDPKDHHTLIAPVDRPLAAGSYLVKWRAVSTDTHRMTGSYGFRVQP